MTSTTTDTNYRTKSFWLDSLVESGTDDLVPRAALSGDEHADVVVIGAGLTGLWTAYYLNQRDSSLKIAVLEQHIAGFGASGRNGGWCSALFPASTAALERRHGRPAALAMRRAMIDTVDEVGRVTAKESIDCDFIKGGTVAFARDRVQLRAARAEVAEAKSYGVDQLDLWDAERSPVGLGASWDPACARLQPAKLVRRLAELLERRGVRIYERSEVLGYGPRRVVTAAGSVTSTSVIVATEGYGAPGAATDRAILPLYSLMIATEPMPDALWQEIGIEHGQTFTDHRHLLIYGQRTADNRFAFGGRGARYHWGSSIRPEYDRDPRVFEHLRASLVGLFPQAADAAITHRWGGPLGVPRDWHASVNYDPRTGLGRAGGYVGDGLSTTNLAGRTLAELIIGDGTGTAAELTRLPWVGHHSPRWEPEPWRFLGSNLGLTAMTVADAEEGLTGRASIAARLMGPLVGH